MIPEKWLKLLIPLCTDSENDISISFDAKLYHSLAIFVFDYNAYVSSLGGGLSNLPRLKSHKRKRFSSYDRTGGNRDFHEVPEGETRVSAEMKGAGCVKHIWVTIRTDEEWYLRKLVLRMYWDGEENPSVEVPIGDFFGIGHGITHNYVSWTLQMSPEEGKAFNCWWPMP